MEMDIDRMARAVPPDYEWMPIGKRFRLAFNEYFGYDIPNASTEVVYAHMIDVLKNHVPPG